MAKNNITQYDATAANNTDIDSINIAEGMAASDVNNAIRSLMSHLKNMDTGSQALTSPSFTAMSTDTINEKTSTNGVAIDSVTLKDGELGTTASPVPINSSSLNGGQFGGRRNILYNGAMMVAQRGTTASFAGSGGGYVSLDRFKTFSNGGGALTLSQETDVPSGEGFINSMKVTVNTADSSIATGDYYVLQQNIEGNACSHLMQGTANAETITISFYVKSSLTGNFGGALNNNASNRAYPFQYTINSANTWEKITKTITLDTSGTWATDNTIGLRLQWDFGSGATFQGTANAWASANYHTAPSSVQLIGTNSATWFVTGFQIEVGSVATPFEHRSFGEEKRLCQRYYQQETVTWQLGVEGTRNTLLPFPHKVSMRSAPTSTLTGGSASNGVLLGTSAVTSETTGFHFWKGGSGSLQNAVFSGYTFKADAEL